MNGKLKNDRELLREFAHEIRNPLNALKAYSDMIRGEGGIKPSLDQIDDYAGHISNASLVMLQICERVLDESVQGHPVLKKQDVDFQQFCPEIVQTFEAEADVSGVVLSYVIEDGFPVMYTDPVVLFEIMSNLIGNALKFTPEGGRVTVSGEMDHKDETLSLVVQDTGKGIPSTIARSIMKGACTTTTFAHSNRQGWGQGMQTILEKAGLLGGSLQIENAHNGGTIATVLLPMKECLNRS